jgi:DNA-binding beta-propeller fold protein YncE
MIRRPILALLCFALAAIAPAPALALSDEEELGRFGSTGSGAGQVYVPAGIATDPVSGHVFIADVGNNRIAEFTAFGKFVKAWGWGVVDGKDELQVCTTICRKGIAGSGPGQLDAPRGMAVDSTGNVYVREPNPNNRVQKFRTSGEFLLAFGGEVNVTTGGDVCTAASGDECGSGVEGSGPGEFGVGLAIAVGPTGTIFVPDQERINEFEPDGSFKSEVEVPGETVRFLALDPASGNFYVVFGTFASTEDDVFELSPSGVVLGSLEVKRPKSVAIGPAGNVFVVEEEDKQVERPERVLEFDPNGEQVSSFAVPPLRPGFEGASGRRFELTGLGTNTAGDLYVSNASGLAGDDNFIRFFGPPPVKFESPPPVVPTVLSQYPASVAADDAILRAQINPHFWQDANYYVEYGTGSCAAGECSEKQPIPPALLTSQATSKAVTTGNIALAGLQAGTAYHYRFVSESSGGGPVFGVDPDGDGPKEATFADGLEGTFQTFPEEDAVPACPNDAFRIGASALLPDCRAYEMVSPVDKANGDIAALIDLTGFETRLDQSSVDGEALTYSSYRAFGDAKGASYTSQYLASRGPSGWSSESLNEPRGPSSYGVRLAGENEFKAFSPDLCDSWLVREADPQLAPGAIDGFPNLYRRGNCPKSYEAITTVVPPIVAPEDYIPDLQGRSADGSKTIFRVSENLTADAPAQPPDCAGNVAECRFRLYEASAGGLSLVCILPGELPFAGDCSAGTPPRGLETTFNRMGSVNNALSADGSRIYWSASSVFSNRPGRLYLRLNGTSTVEVSGKASSAEARFWGASADGSKALFSIEDQTAPITVLDHNFYEYDLATETATLIAGKLIGIAGASEDLSHVYFISEEAISGNGTAGKANLYLRAGGTITFIATLSSDDVRLPPGRRLPSNATSEPIYHAARVTPDGRRLAFISNEPLTGADNTDANSGEADSEVFTYAADTGELACASCSPAGARPEGRRVQAQAAEGFLWTAASLPLGSNQLFTPRALSEDGNRLFFTAYADLLPRDENGKADVYEWELPGTSASCENEADPDFYAANGGCLFLISSGQSPQDSEFVDADPDGENAFIATQQSLLPQDPDLIDIYVARIGGGFAPPPPPPTPCVGEACQAPAVPPIFRAPVSNSPALGNPLPKRPKCPKGKHRVDGKGKCVKNKKGKRNHKQRKGGRSAR